MILRSCAAVTGIVAAALALLTQETKTNPAEAARLNNLGCAYMNQQLFEKGLASFKQAVEIDPNLAVARLNEGIAYLNLQKIDEAKAELDHAVEEHSRNPYAWYNLGLLAKNTGDTQAAIDAFKHVTEIVDNDADTWYFLGAAYVQAKQFPPAIEAFQRALKLNPLHASAEFGLSRAYQQSTDTDHAREHLKRFQYITQNKIGAPMSLAYGEQGQFSRAVESPAYLIKPPAQIRVQFVDVTKEAGIASHPLPRTSGDHTLFIGPGACFLDYDGDGRIDLLLADNGPEGGVALLHNVGGKFEDVTGKAGFDPATHASGCAVGDYDNDGATDVVLTTPGKISLFHNEKNGAFKDATGATGIKGPDSNVSATFVDYDHDGDLDLYVTARREPPAGVAKRRVTGANALWRNNGDGTFTDVTDTVGFDREVLALTAVGTDYNNDRAIDLIVAGVDPASNLPVIYENPREGKFPARQPWTQPAPPPGVGIAVLDFDHDGWMDIAFTQWEAPGLALWHNGYGKTFERVKLPATNWVRGYGVVAFDYDNDGWIDLAAIGETKEGKGEVRLFRNLGPDGFKDVTAEVGLDKIELKAPRAIITGDYDNDGAADLLITQNHGPAILLRNEGGNQNHWIRLALKGLNDNKSAIGAKVEIFAGGNRQKFETYGSNGFLGENSPYLTVGLGDAKEADIVRMLWPTGVLQDEIQVAADKQQDFLELDRRGSSCPTLFAWNGERYEFVADMLGAGVVGHWVGPGQRDIPRPVEWIKIPTGLVREKTSAALLSFRFTEPLEEAVYLDQVRLLAVDHPVDVEVYPNEYFASNPPYPEFKVVQSRDAHPPAGAWDEHRHDVLPELLAHRYFGDFELTQFQGFARLHTLTLDLGKAYNGGPLWLLLHGEVEYFSANSMYAASQAGIQAIAPYVEAQVAGGSWKRVVDDMGFPAGGPRTMTADLTGKLPLGTKRIRIITNLQVYWDTILIDRTEQGGVQQMSGSSTRSGSPLAGIDKARSQAQSVRMALVPLVQADLEFHGYPLKVEGTPPGNVNYIYEKASATGPYTRPFGTYTRYGDVLPLLDATDDKLVVFGSGDEVRLDFDPSKLRALPKGWVRDYFFAANGYEKDMDFYAAEGPRVAPLPFLNMGEYPYPARKEFPLDDEHINYLLEYNTRHMSGNEQRGYWFDYAAK